MQCGRDTERGAAGGLLGISACADADGNLAPDVFSRALRGLPFTTTRSKWVFVQRRWFEVDVPAAEGALGIVGLVVLSIEITEHRPRRQSQSNSDRGCWRSPSTRAISLSPRRKARCNTSAARQKFPGYTTEEQRRQFFDQVTRTTTTAARQYGSSPAARSRACPRVQVAPQDGPTWLESSYTSALDNPLIGAW